MCFAGIVTENESNNTPGTATVIPNQGISVVQAVGVVAGGADMDWFKFSVNTLNNITISILSGTVNVSVYGEGDTVNSIMDLTYNGTDDNGKVVSSGVYFIKMISNNYSKVTKAILLK